MARVSRHFPQPGSTTRSLTILTYHRSGLAMICHNLVKRASEKYYSTSSLAGKAGQPHLYELSSEISTEASKTTSQGVTAVYLQGSLVRLHHLLCDSQWPPLKIFISHHLLSQMTLLLRVEHTMFNICPQQTSRG